MAIGGTLGTLTLGQMPGGGEFLTPEQLGNREAWSIYVCTGDLRIIGQLTEVVEAVLTETQNGAWELQLKVSYGDTYREYLDRPYAIQVYSRDGSLYQSFLIWQRAYDSDADGGEFVTLGCLSLLSALSKTHPESDVEFPATTTIRTYIDTILGWANVNSPILKVGRISNTIRLLKRPISVTTEDNGLGVLMRLFGMVGGAFRINGRGQFYWEDAAFGMPKSVEYTKDANLLELHLMDDYSDVRNRVATRGSLKYQRTTRYATGDLLGYDDWVEGGPASITKHGTCHWSETIDNLRSLEAVLDVSAQTIAKRQNGGQSFAGVVQDRSQLAQYEYSSAYAIVVGASARIVHPEVAGGSASFDIVRVTRTLLDPDIVEVEFGDLEMSLVEWMADTVITQAQPGGGAPVAPVDDAFLPTPVDPTVSASVGSDGDTNFAARWDHGHAFVGESGGTQDVIDTLENIADPLYAALVGAMESALDYGNLDGIAADILALQQAVAALQQAIADLDEIPLPSVNVQRVSMDGSPGTESFNKYARGDSSPRGMPRRRASNKSALVFGIDGPIEPGQFCTTHDDRAYFVTTDGDVVCMTNWPPFDDYVPPEEP